MLRSSWESPALELQPEEPQRVRSLSEALTWWWLYISCLPQLSESCLQANKTGSKAGSAITCWHNPWTLLKGILKRETQECLPDCPENCHPEEHPTAAQAFHLLDLWRHVGFVDAEGRRKSREKKRILGGNLVKLKIQSETSGNITKMKPVGCLQLFL